MNDFEKVYKDMVEQIPSLNINAASVLNEARHRKAVAAQRRQRVAALMLIFCVLTMGAFGTVTAVNYKQSVIRVNEYGFTSADAKTMAANTGVNSKVESFAAGAETGDDSGQVMPAVLPPEQEADARKENAMVMTEDIIQQEYDSVEAFAEESDVIAAFPNFALFRADIEEEYIVVNGNFLLAIFTADKKRVSMSQMDFRECESFASTTQYSDKVYNERTFTTQMGFQYTLVDSRNAFDNTVSIHAAISVGGRELVLDFDGFYEEEVEEILKELDLTVYFQ